MNSELLAVLEHIERERGIEKELLFKAIESALVSAARKIVGKKEAEVNVSIDRATGEIKIMSSGKEIASDEFGRIAAQTAKQVIIQKIREAERDVIFDEYQKKVGMITHGNVHRFEKGDIVIDLGRVEAILPRSQQCPRERYKLGDRIRAYIVEVNKTPHGPEIVLSRASPGFVRKLFELEVPEILEGIVEVRAISRDAGERTKIAVWSKDDKVDPVGACVGMRGSRVKDIVRELQGERIDIIRWSEDIKEYIKAALNPAQVSQLTIDKQAKKVQVFVEDDQLSIAIGKHGQNVRLASKLVEWEIDIVGKDGKKSSKENEKDKKDQQEKEPAAQETSLLELKGVGEKLQKVLGEAGYASVESLRGVKPEDLIKLPGIGQKTAERIVKSVEEFLTNERESKKE